MLVVTLVQIKHQIFIFVICDQINKLNYIDLFDFDCVNVSHMSRFRGSDWLNLVKYFDVYSVNQFR